MMSDRLECRFVEDQVMRVKLAATSSAVLGWARTGARQSEPSAGQRVEIHARTIILTDDQGACEGDQCASAPASVSSTPLERETR